MLATVRATRYVAPLREGGSLPGLMEADDDGTYVVKYRGAGQGAKALVAELVAGEIGRALGLPVPAIALVELDAAFARLEMDPEIQYLLRASEGLNLALDFLPGSITFDALVPPPPEARFAADVLWFDAFVTNIDRTARNANMLVWHGDVWLIDHGASLGFQHDWGTAAARATDPFRLAKDHVLLPFVHDIGAADDRAKDRIDAAAISTILGAVPDSWLELGYGGEAPATVRATYLDYFSTRLTASMTFVEEAARARARLV